MGYARTTHTHARSSRPIQKLNVLPGWRNGKRGGLKIRYRESDLWVRVPSPALIQRSELSGASVTERASPFLMMLRRMKCGLRLDSSRILPMYSPSTPMPRISTEPKNRITRITVVSPRGARPG